MHGISRQPRSVTVIKGKRATLAMRTKVSKVGYRWYSKKPGKT